MLAEHGGEPGVGLGVVFKYGFGFFAHGGDFGGVVVLVEHGGGVDADAFGGANRAEAVFKHPGVAGVAADGFAGKLDEGWLGFAQAQVEAAVEVFEAVADAGAREQGVGEGFVVVGHEHHRQAEVVQAVHKVVGAGLEWGHVGVDAVGFAVPGVGDFFRGHIEVVEVADHGGRLAQAHGVDFIG